jgi:hypothetical protein
MSLNLNPNIARPDEFYERLINALKDRSDEESQKFCSKLVLILANHIGDMDVLEEALVTADTD